MKIKDKNANQDIYIPPQATEEEQIFEEPQIDRDLVDLFELLQEEDPENAPLLSVIESWKSRHRSLYVSKVSNDSKQYYVFTTIKRHDFKKLQEQGVFENDEKANEVLVEKCLLYPHPTMNWRLTSDAGIITTVGKQIAYKSGFVTQQEALSLIKII